MLDGQSLKPADFQGLVHNTPLFIALTVKICEVLDVPFIVAPFEADSQVPGIGNIVLSDDSDIAVLDVPRWVIVDDWITGGGYLIYISSYKTCDLRKFLLVSCYLKHGVLVF